MRLRMTLRVLFFGLLLIFMWSARYSWSAEKKVSTPAQGDKSGQVIPVDQPYCDAYAPYSYSGNDDRQVTPLLDPLKYDFDPTLQNDHDEISRFLDRKLTVGAPVGKKGELLDPGYPIFGDPSKHLYADGTDVQRVLVRLFAADSGGRRLTTELCQDPSTKNYVGQVPSEATNAQARSSYYLIHIVRWVRANGEFKDVESSWYVFNRNDPKAAHRQFPFSFHPYTSGDLRIFGDSRVFFLSIHLAPTGTVGPKSAQPQGAADAYAAFRKSVAISYKLAVKKIEPANIQDLKALLGIITGAKNGAEEATDFAAQSIATYAAFVNSSVSRPYTGVYGAAVLTGLDHLPVQITATMTAKFGAVDKSAPDLTEYQDDIATQLAPLPVKPEVAPAKNLNSSGSQPSDETQKPNPSSTSKKPTAIGANSGSSNPNPQPGCSNVASGTCTETAVAQDEGLYWWDFSVGVPFKGYKELQYSNGSVSPKTVSKGSAYGFLALAPWKEDIVTPPSLGIPHFLVGLPLQGKVFDAPVFAAGETINVASIPKVGPGLAKAYPIALRFYCGVVYNKEFGAPIAGDSSLPSHRVAKLQYGIEFSVRSIASKLSTATASTKKSTSAKTSFTP